MHTSTSTRACTRTRTCAPRESARSPLAYPYREYNNTSTRDRPRPLRHLRMPPRKHLLPPAGTDAHTSPRRSCACRIPCSLSMHACMHAYYMHAPWHARAYMNPRAHALAACTFFTTGARARKRMHVHSHLFTHPHPNRTRVGVYYIHNRSRAGARPSSVRMRTPAYAHMHTSTSTRSVPRVPVVSGV